MPPRARRAVALVAVAAALAGCVAVPVTREVYDHECRMIRREATVELTVIGGYQSCVNRDCALVLAAAGLVTAASVVVSGSIAVVGNVIYWAEERGRCPGKAAPAPAAAANAPAT